MKIRFRLPVDASRQSSLTTPLRLLLATTAACWMGAAQPQVATTALGRATTGLRFQDLFPMPIGRTDPQISELVHLASASVVRLVGYMVQQGSPAPGRFMLAPRPVQLAGHAGSGVDDIPAATVVVYLDPGQQDLVVPHVKGLLIASGRLQVGRNEESDGSVSWVRLQLDPEATRGIDAVGKTGYLHRLPTRHRAR